MFPTDSLAVTDRQSSSAVLYFVVLEGSGDKVLELVDENDVYG